MVNKVQAVSRELGPIFIVAVAVALASTLAGSVFDHIHQIDAEALAPGQATSTAVAAGAQQTLILKNWGVQATTPLAAAMPLISYVGHDQTSIGLSSANLQKLDPACTASQNALGALIRYPHGTYGAYAHDTAIEYYLVQVGDYDYAYQLPAGACAQIPGAQVLINQQTSVLREALGGLAAIQP